MASIDSSVYYRRYLSIALYRHIDYCSTSIVLCIVIPHYIRDNFPSRLAQMCTTYWGWAVSLRYPNQIPPMTDYMRHSQKARHSVESTPRTKPDMASLFFSNVPCEVKLAMSQYISFIRSKEQETAVGKWRTVRRNVCQP